MRLTLWYRPQHRRFAGNTALDTGCRDFYRALRELPDRQDDTENEDRVNQSLENTTAFLFRAY